MSTFLATIETTRGTITAELHDRDCPDTVETFVRLANAGFYDDAPVAAVAPGLYVEATTRDGHAHDEPLPIEAIGNRNRPEPGALVLGRAGDEGDATRLLFVTGTASGAPFAGTHTVFGMAADGMTVIAGLRVGDVLKSVRVRQ